MCKFLSWLKSTKLNSTAAFLSDFQICVSYWWMCTFFNTEQTNPMPNKHSASTNDDNLFFKIDCGDPLVKATYTTRPCCRSLARVYFSHDLLSVLRPYKCAIISLSCPGQSYLPTRPFVRCCKSAFHSAKSDWCLRGGIEYIPREGEEEEWIREIRHQSRSHADNRDWPDLTKLVCNERR